MPRSPGHNQSESFPKETFRDLRTTRKHLSENFVSHAVKREPILRVRAIALRNCIEIGQIGLTVRVQAFGRRPVIEGEGRYVVGEPTRLKGG